MGTGQALLKASASKLGGLLFLPSCGTSQVTSSSAQDGIGKSSGHGGSRSRGKTQGNVGHRCCRHGGLPISLVRHRAGVIFTFAKWEVVWGLLPEEALRLRHLDAERGSTGEASAYASWS